jgi:hypothetical protein
MARSLGFLFLALVVLLLVDFAFFESALQKETWAQIQTQQTSVQQWKVNFVSRN